MTEALQDRYFPNLPCFGCGPSNAKGLQLKSYTTDAGITAQFTPWPEHDNGVGFLNGGIISTVLDCHSAAAVTFTAFAHGWEPDEGADLPYVTAGLNVRYLRPAPLEATVRLSAEVQEASPDQITAYVALHHDGKVRAEADATWKRWRVRR